MKIAGIGATGVAAALIAGTPPDWRGRQRRRAGGADAVINAGLVAGGANLLNLFDLRPGRAIKVAIGTGGLLAAARRGRAARRAAARRWRPLARCCPRISASASMLGDAGANALGAMLGVAAATALPRPARVGALAASSG